VPDRESVIFSARLVNGIAVGKSQANAGTFRPSAWTEERRVAKERDKSLADRRNIKRLVNLKVARGLPKFPARFGQ
jgi:hypothetical protein